MSNAYRMKDDGKHLLVDEKLSGQTTSQDFENVGEPYQANGKPGKRSWCTQIYSFTLHAMLLIVCVELMRQYATHQPYILQRYHSPASSVIHFQERDEHATNHDSYKFSGPPSEEYEQAWESLVEPTLISATRNELIAAGESFEDATKLADGSGYLAALGVYHEMHCLRSLRFYLYKDTYYPNISAANEENMQGHLDHCLELIRVSLACTANISLYTFKWEDGNLEKPRLKSNSRRYCMDWEALEDWSGKRSVGIDALLERPEWMTEDMHDKLGENEDSQASTSTVAPAYNFVFKPDP